MLSGSLINDTYIEDFNRIAQSLEDRVELTGENPSVILMSDQLALRAVVYSQATIRRELSALRTILTFWISHQTWPFGILIRPWLDTPDPQAIDTVFDQAKSSAGEHYQRGLSLIARMVEDLRQSGIPGSQEDIANRLTRNVRIRKAHPVRDQKSFKPISDAELFAIDHLLSGSDYINAIRHAGSKRTDHKAMLRVFIKTLALTGMRPIEVFECRIFLPDPDRVYTDEERKEIAARPTVCALRGDLVPIERVFDGDWSSYGSRVYSLCKLTGIPPVLVIQNAKITNGNKELVQKYRGQVLSGIDPEDLNILCIAASFHTIDWSASRRQNLTSALAKHFTVYAQAALPEREEGLRLYDMRHNFSTRARRRMGIHEVAATMGHTARSSTRGYGAAFVRRRAGASGGWLPQADPEIAERLKEGWGVVANDLLPSEILTEDTTKAAADGRNSMPRHEPDDHDLIEDFDAAQAELGDPGLPDEAQNLRPSR